MNDDQDSVRIICFENIEIFTKTLNKEEFENHILKTWL